MKRIILLDLGGVVFGPPHITDNTESSVLHELFERYGTALDLDELPRFDSFMDAYNEALGSAITTEAFFTRLYDHRTFNTELIEYLQRFTVYITSNNYKANTEYLTKRFKPSEWSSGQFYSYEMGVAKPDPAFFTQILTAIGASASECIFIDDNEKNVRAAIALGISGIRFETNAQTFRAIEELKNIS
ncbi:MAG: HAD-IA family hydrolase [Candidatus Woesearchaeota archaeon]